MSIKDKIVRALALRWLAGKVKALRGEKEGQMSGLGKAWKFFEGWKLVLGVAGLFGCGVWDNYHNGHSGQFVSSVLVTLGWLPPGEWTIEAISKASLAAVTLVGFGAKLWAAQAQSRAGVPAIALLSPEGYIHKAVTDSIKSEVANAHYTKIADDAAALAEAKQ